MEITTTTEILSSATGRRNSISKLANKTNRAISNIVEGKKFATRAELDKSGLSRRFDNAHAMLLKTKANQTTLDVAETKLLAQAQAVEDLNKIMVTFETDRINQTSTGIDEILKVEKALSAISQLLQRKNLAGEYVFGGSNPFNNPLNVREPDGSQRKVDLVHESNLMYKKTVVNSFSEADANPTVITASSQHEVKQNFLYGGMQTLVDTIGYLHTVKRQEIEKQDPDAFPGADWQVEDEDVIAMDQTQRTERNNLEIQVSIELEKIKEARHANKNDNKIATDTLHDFQGDVVALSSTAKDLMQSFVAAITVANSRDAAFQKLLEKAVF